VPRTGEGIFGLPGEMLPGMVLCVERYIGDPETRQGVKLEDQYVVHDDRVERLSRYPLEPRLTSAIRHD